jgi:DNA-directed RNA polymerase subunit M/transcription elongation factor TFIIS
MFDFGAQREPATQQQTFACPACRGRLVMSREHERGSLTCPHCDTTIAAPPFFSRRRLGTAKPWPELHVACEHCGEPHRVDARWFGRSLRCGYCDRVTPVAQPGWWAWHRPVAKFLTQEDLRRSLHHRMLATGRRAFADSAIPADTRRRFAFYCGHCGSLHEARVWDIASQMACEQCDVMLIIPPPLRNGSPHATESPTPPAERQSDGPHVFCTACGEALTHAEAAGATAPPRCTRCGSNQQRSRASSLRW